MDGKDETGWLIEFGGVPARWWCGRAMNHHNYTSNPNDCIRFARKQDAEAIIFRFLDGVGFATEHIWIPMPRGSPTPSEAQQEEKQ